MDNCYDLFQSCNTNHSFLVINKNLIKELGLQEAVLISDLASKHRYFVEKGMSKKDGWFFNTEEDRQDHTGLTSHQQRKCIQNLTSNGMIETQRKDIPAKIYFKINYDKLLETLVKSERGQVIKKTGTCSLKNGDLPLKKRGLYNNNKNKNKNNNKKNPPNPPGGNVGCKKIIRYSSPPEMGEAAPHKKQDKTNSPFSESLNILPTHFKHDRDFISIWRQWFEYRAEIKKKVSPISIKRQINMLTKYSTKEAIEIIDRSITNGWTGLFPPNKNNNHQPINKHVSGNGQEWEEQIRKHIADNKIVIYTD